jgi:NitT/TauT family transport system substrate-binding protein
MRRSRRFAIVLLTALPVALVACGGDDEPASRGADRLDRANPVSIKVGDVEGAPSSFLAFGVEKGFFADRGLDVKLVQQQGGAAIVPGLVSGDLQIGGSNVVSMLLARDRGLAVKIIAPGTSVGTDPERDFSAVVVAADSPITSVRDLTGRTVAVNTLKNVNEIVLKANLETQGVQPESLKYLELGFSDMLAAVTQRRVDAALVIEPFATIGQSQGLRVVLRPYVGARPNLGVGTYSASEDYISANPAVIRAVREAAAQTASHITANPDEYRTALPRLTNVQAQLAPRVNIPVWAPRLDADSLEFFADRMLRYGLVKTKPDVTAAVLP